MGFVLLIIVSVIVVAAMVLIVGRALGDPQKSPRFDEMPADVMPLDVSDGTPLDLTYNPLAPDWDVNIPRQMSPEEQEQATKQFERLRVQIEAER